ncbi:polysaccharide lyase 6 family protein, partial [Vibrio rarus]
PDASIPATPIEPSIPVTPDTPTDPDDSTPLPPITPDAGYSATGIPLGVQEVPEVNCTEVFTSTSELEEAVSTEMAPGTTLCLADGEYSQGLEIKFAGPGTEDQPIKVAAQNPGKAIINGGEVEVIMGGTYTQLQGFVFDGVEFNNQLISTRLATLDLCKHCRITEVSIIDAVTEKDYGILVHIYGQHIWLDHNIISGKTAKNPMISFNRWVDSSWDEATIYESLAQDIVVYKNYIANRAPADNKLYADGGDNDYEAIRTGLSDTHHYDGNSFVVANLFEQIQGEAEVISNKGSHNVISHNTIRNSYGSLTNRHGHGSTIDNNFIISDDFPLSGGLRIVDGDHSVTNNYIEGARYLSTTHHGGIVLLGSDGAGDSDNGYQQVDNVHLAHNTVVDSVNSLNLDGGGKKMQPRNVFLSNNLVDQAIGPVFRSDGRGVPESSSISGNIVHGESLSDDDGIKNSSGFEFTQAYLAKHSDDGLYRPTDSSPNLDALSDYEKGSFTAVTLDMDGQARSNTTLVGADEVSDETRLFKPLSYADVGPTHYTLDKPTPIMVETTIANAAFDHGLDAWSGSATLVTGSDSFARNGSVQVKLNESLSQEVELLPNHDYVLSAFIKGAYRLEVAGIKYQQDVLSDESYQWVTMPFNSGDNTSGDVILGLPDSVTLYADVQDGDLGQWREDGGSSDVWVQYEGVGGDDVGSSGDSAFNDDVTNGSARVRFKKGEDSYDFTAKPGLSQKVTGLPADKDMTFSMYYCDNKGDDSASTLHYGVKDSNDNIIIDARAHVKDLDDAPEGSVKNCFKQVTVDFNSSSYNDVEIFAYMEIDTENFSQEQLEALVDSDKELEVRIDEFSITYQGAPSDDAVGYFDEIRLVTRNDQ